LGVIGFCRGGRDTWLYAEHNAHLKAAVAFYGPVAGASSVIQPKTPLDLAAGLKCPLLGLYGGADDGIRIEDVKKAAALAERAGQTVHIEVFPGAPHGFHADYRATYHKDAAVAAWAHATAWLRAHGVA
jgi:carboxymethylenebutenolidase